MNDLIVNVRIEGEVLYEGTNIYSKDVDVVEIRKEDRNGFSEAKPISYVHI